MSGGAVKGLQEDTRESGETVKRGQEEQYRDSGGAVQSNKVGHNFHLCRT